MITQTHETPQEEHHRLRAVAANLILTTNPRSHSLGMLQFQIDHDSRVHVWHPRLSRFSQEETGHQHRFDMVSTVLHGSIVQVDVSIIPGGSYSLIEFDEDLVARSTGETCDVSLSSGRILAGSNYSMRREQYHQFTIDELAITYVQRLGVGGKSKALFPVGRVPRSGRTEDIQADADAVLAEARMLVQDWVLEP